MRMSITAVLALLTLAATGPRTLAQSERSAHTLKLDKKENMPPAKIDDVGWMAGHWRGKALGGVVEEVWAPPLGGAMMGMFRLIKDGKPVFYELMMVIEQNNSLALRVKHFHPDFKGWEEKDKSVDFPLVKMGVNEAFFDGLTIRKEEDGSLGMFVVFGKKGGGFREEEFVYRAVKENASR